MDVTVSLCSFSQLFHSVMWMGMMGVDGHARGGCESVDVTVSLCSFPQLFHSVMWMGMMGVDGCGWV